MMFVNSRGFLFSFSLDGLFIGEKGVLKSPTINSLCLLVTIYSILHIEVFLLVSSTELDY